MMDIYLALSSDPMLVKLIEDVTTIVTLVGKASFAYYWTKRVFKED